MKKRRIEKKTRLKIWAVDAAMLMAVLLVMLAPAAPAPVVGLKVAASTYSTADLEWKDSTNAKGYRVYRSVDGGEMEYIESTPDNKFHDDNLKTGTTYRYAVVSRNGIKNSDLSKKHSIEVIPKLNKPELKIETKNGKIELHISDVEGAISYEISRDNETIGQSTETTFVDEKANADQTHKYKVKAVRYKKNPVYSEYSNTAEAELHAIPNIVFTADADKIEIDWDSSDYYNDYKLYKGDELLSETQDTYYAIEGYNSDEVYDIKLVGFETDSKVQSPTVEKKLKVFEEPMDNEGARKAACEWGVEIANDNSFAYGTGNTAHRTGCYFCGTNSRKKGPGYEKTYCCNPFVHACYAHGAQDPQMLKTCQRGGSIGMDEGDYTHYGVWKNVGKPSISELEMGDVLVSGGHVMMYIGDGELVHAKEEGWGAGTITTDRCSSFYGMVSFVMRYTGTGSGTIYKVREVDDKGNPIKTDDDENKEESEENKDEES